MINLSQSWKKNIEEILREAKQIPLMGELPPFSWEAFNAIISKRFESPGFHIEHHRTDWIPAGKWQEGLGLNPQLLAVETTALKNRLFLVTSSEEVRETGLALLTANKHNNHASRETHPSFFQGFYRFLFLEVLDALAEIDAFPGLHFTLADPTAIPDEPLLAIEVAIELKGTKTFAKILIPAQALSSFREFYRSEGGTQIAENEAARLNVVFSLVIGESSLRHSTWKELSIGDLLLLDRCEYFPNKKHGKAHLVLEGKPIALCSMKGHSIEILDYAAYEEEPMKYGDEEEPEEEFSSFEENDDDEDYDEEETNDGETSDEDETPEDETSHDEEDFDEEMSDEDEEHYDDDTQEEQNPEEDYDDESHEENAQDEEFVEEEYGEELNAGEKRHNVIPTEKEAQPLTKDLLITLSVEVTRIKMSLDKVLALRPGNILELSSSPEQGVTLTSGGRAVARGELIQLGEVVGIKITHLS